MFASSPAATGMVGAAAAKAAQLRRVGAIRGDVAIAYLAIGAKSVVPASTYARHAVFASGVEGRRQEGSTRRATPTVHTTPYRKKERNQNNSAALALNHQRQQIQCLSVMLHMAACAARRTQHGNEVCSESCNRNLPCEVCPASCSKSYC